jgi:hypothetical protein
MGNLQAWLANNPWAQDFVFIFAVIGFLYAWKMMVEGLIE